MITITEKLQKRLQELIASNHSFGIALNGKWGVGKTVFWNKFIEDNLLEKKTAYVSLFGIESVQDIERKIIFQISVKDRLLLSVKDKLKDFKTTFGLKDEDINLGLTGSILSIGLSLFEKKDFENVIVCFDDFERISDKLKLKDVLGLISELKEQKKCTVVMILNKDELDDENFSKYKDKIVDYDLNYEPTPKESFELVKTELITFHDYALEYFQTHNINNIRIMKRVINALNDYGYIEDLLKDYKGIEREIIENILEISTINAIDLSVDFKKLSKYSNPYDWDEIKNREHGQSSKEKPKIQKYDELLEYINLGNSNYFHMSEITYNMVSYVKNSIVNKEELQKIIDERIEKIQYDFVEKQIRVYSYKARYDLTYSFASYALELFSILEVHQTNMTNILNSDSFLFYIQQLKEFDSVNIKKYDEFAINILQKYISQYLGNSNQRNSLFDEESIQNIVNFDKALKEYYENYQVQEEVAKISTKEKITELMLNPIRNSSWGEEPHLLAQVSEEKLEEYFYEDMNFVDESLSFLSNSISRYEGFQTFASKLLKVMEKISQNGNLDQQIKMKKILKYLERKQ